MKNLILFLLLAIVVISFSCTKNSVIDGGLSIAEVNMTTLDYLKSTPHHQFDTLIILLKAAGIDQEVNSANQTFVAPTDYAFRNFIIEKQAALRIIYNDENYVYNYDSLKNEIVNYKDTLRMYMIPGKINRVDLVSPRITKSTSNVIVALQLIESKLYTEWVPNSIPKFLWFSKVINGFDKPNDITIPLADQDPISRCQTSGIITTNGILHVLDDDHIFGFRHHIAQ